MSTRFRSDVARESDIATQIRGVLIDIARLQAEVVALDGRVDASIIAALDRTTLTFAASQRAIDKAEEAQKSYNASHNDITRKMEDQYGHMLPRSEAHAIMDRMREDIKELRDQQNLHGGQSKGMKDMWALVFGIGMALAGLAVAIAALLKG